MNDILKNILKGAVLGGVVGIILLLIGGYIFSIIVPVQQSTFTDFANAPDCNGTFPQQAGICKWSNHTWIVCKNATGYEADEHLRNMAWCEPVELYDVRT